MVSISCIVDIVMLYFYKIYTHHYSIPNDGHADIEAWKFWPKIDVQPTFKIWHPHEKYRLMVSISCIVNIVMLYVYKIYTHTYSIPIDNYADV